MLFAVLGIIYTNDLFNAYVFMEIISITTCSIISIKRKKETYAASFRYVMLNEIGSLSYLFGVALIYMVTGYTNMDYVAQSIQSIWQLYSINIILALALMIIGIGIKAAIFTLHIWLPDAHASAPSSSSAILSSIVVIVYIVVLIKLLFKVFQLDVLNQYHVSTILVIVASTGMIMGSIFAIAQKDIKRMLGYSSVSQIGYIVMGIAMFSSLGLSSALFHIISHGLMKAALFLSVGIIIYKKKIRNKNQFEGLAYEMPISMGVFAIAGLGMIGIPLTSGFISKLTLGVASLDHRQGYLIIIVVLSGLLNVIYYLPIIIASFLKSEPQNYHPFKIEKVPWPMLTAVVILGIGILTFGIFPNLVMNMLTEAANLFGLA
jgi:multicomponent Na+:H+ antiporter subunit D